MPVKQRVAVDFLNLSIRRGLRFFQRRLLGGDKQDGPPAVTNCPSFSAVPMWNTVAFTASRFPIGALFSRAFRIALAGQNDA